MKKSYNVGEFVYFTPKGEIVKIIGSTKKSGVFRDKYYIRVLSLSNIDPKTGKAIKYYDCNYQSLKPINDKDIQFLLKMHFNNETFNLIRRL